MNNRNKALVILGLIILGVALAIFGFTAILNGFNIIEWLKSTSAMWCYILIGIYILTVLFVVIGDKVKNL